jgi:hypothetical protein
VRKWADAVTERDDRPDLQAQAMAALRFSYDLDAPIAQDVAWVRRSLAVVDKVSDPQLQVYILGQAAGVLVVTGDVGWRTPAGARQCGFPDRAGRIHAPQPLAKTTSSF